MVLTNKSYESVFCYWKLTVREQTMSHVLLVLLIIYELTPNRFASTLSVTVKLNVLAAPF